VLALALAAAAVGCAQPGYDPSKLQSELRRAGVTQVQATCITNGLENDFDINQLASHSDPTADQDATTRTIITKCGVKLPAK